MAIKKAIASHEEDQDKRRVMAMSFSTRTCDRDRQPPRGFSAIRRKDPLKSSVPGSSRDWTEKARSSEVLAGAPRKSSSGRSRKTVEFLRGRGVVIASTS